MFYSYITVLMRSIDFLLILMCLMTFLMTSVTTVSSQILLTFSLPKKKKKGKERVLIVYCIFRMRITVLFEVIWGLKNIEGDVKKKKEEEIHVLEVTHFWTNLLWETVA